MTAELGQLAEEPEGRFLGGVPRPIRVTEQAEAEAVPRVLQGTQQACLSGTVSASGGVDVGRRFVFHAWSVKAGVGDDPRLGV